MARSFHQNTAHIVFSTKNRDPLISAALEPKLHAYLAGIVRSLHGHAHIVNGMPDHVHLLARTPSTITAADFMRDLKANSTHWIKQTIPSFAWQGGYGWFSVSTSCIPEVTTYIRSQKEHHHKTSFQDEFLAFLKRHQIDYDERFIWE